MAVQSSKGIGPHADGKGQEGGKASGRLEQGLGKVAPR